MFQSMIQFLLPLIVALPILCAALLLFIPLGPRVAAVLATLSVTGSALGVAMIQLVTPSDFAVVIAIPATWFNLGQPSFNLSLNFGLYLDALSLMMISIITGVGSLIHLYSVAFMAKDPGVQRYFAYLNLFVGAMLLLVLADNLLLLYLGWEGVGLCSYLLIGFWSKDRANNRAANKAFITTRIGDTALLIGLLMIFWQFGSLNIAQINQNAAAVWPLDSAHSNVANLCTLLLFIGAAGKSAQLPLQNWLPDAMAGPTPVSALIHAATMVTAGIYLVVRHFALFQQASATLQLIAVVGTLTLLLGASAAMVQSDLKRILAYSTISQLGYMFLALGVGATAAASFHLMTHAFFKALLFLSAGALIHGLNRQHNIFKMGGLRRSMPVVFISFVVGGAALSSLPLLSGFFSKELILNQVLVNGHPWLWLGAIVGAFMTAFYSARLILLVFFGRLQQAPSSQLPRLMAVVLLVLSVLSIVGGLMPASIELLLPAASPLSQPIALWVHSLAEAIAIITPFTAIILAYYCFKRGVFGTALRLPWQQRLHNFLANGWYFDLIYQRLLIKPFFALTKLNKKDLFDQIYRTIEAAMLACHRQLSRTQTGSLRLYNGVLILFAVVAIGWMLIAHGPSL